MRPLPNGDLFAPHRGVAPAAPPGYVRDKGDDFIFHPIIHTCNHREERRGSCRNCSGFSFFQWCNKHDRKVTVGDCKLCQDGDLDA